MKILKNSTLILLLLWSCTSFAQKSNPFLDRSFWQENPDLKTVKQKVAEGNDAMVDDGNGFDAVVNALLAKADDEVIEYLLTLDGNTVDKRTHDSRTYLHWAAYAGKTTIMKTLLKKGAAIDVYGSHGDTPMTFAARGGQTNMAVYDLLIKNGVDITQEKNKKGANTLLLIAPSLQNEKELSYFTSKGLDLKSTDEQGNGIFTYAASKGHIDFLKLLVTKGVDYKTLNKNGGNAFLFAARGGRGFSNSIEVYQYLKGLGLKPDVITKSGDTPLHYLAADRNADLEIFKFFMVEKSDVNQKNAEGNTPFLNAAAANYLPVVKLLSKHVKGFNTTNKKGVTALMGAVERNNPKVVQFLLKKGSTVDVIDKQGNSLAFYLVNSFDASHPENFEAKLKLLQHKGIKFNKVQEEGNTLYHLAAKANAPELLSRLTDFDIPINAKNENGLTALHLAAMKAKDGKLLKQLIEMGADPNIKTDFEESPYDLASENEMLQNQNVDLSFLM